MAPYNFYLLSFPLPQPADHQLPVDIMPAVHGHGSSPLLMSHGDLLNLTKKEVKAYTFLFSSPCRAAHSIPVLFDANQGDEVIVDVSNIFQNPSHSDVVASVITVGKRFRYLVVGYFDYDLHSNRALKTIKPNLLWKGEVLALSLGQNVPVLTRPVGNKSAVKKAISVFLSRYDEAIALGVKLNPAIDV